MLCQYQVTLQASEATMIVFNAMRDFADGLSRGLSLFFTERREHTVRVLAPAPQPREK